MQPKKAGLRKQGRRSDGGFTLIELLIVIVILGVLAGIVVFSVAGIQDKGEQSACKTDVATLETAVEAYYAKNGTYPSSIADLTTAPNKFLRSAPTRASLGTGGAVTASCGGATPSGSTPPTT